MVLIQEIHNMLLFHNKKIVEIKEADKSLTQITGIVSAYIGKTYIHCPKN